MRAIIKKVKQLIKKIVKGYIFDIFWGIYGLRFHNPEIPNEVKNIIFICKGNICRSAFAHYLAMKDLNIFQLNGDLNIDSAGIEAINGNNSPSNAIQAAKNYDIDLADHRAKKITVEMAGSADMLIAMEPGQVSQIKKCYPDRFRNIFLLAEFERKWNKSYKGWNKYHIEDPYGGDNGKFIMCFERIKACLHGLMSNINANK